ncbi:MAG TPA: septal ring lytic transglycosylase RlpA family protein [Rudaea sp.]|nr:septal ring lytic transglycosylase RlpA family protein [Rudaea sp.]
MRRPGARLALLAALVLLAGCFHRPTTRPQSAAEAPAAKAGGGRYAQDRDSTPSDVPDVSKIPEPVPKSEPRSQYGNKSPYSVLGETYRVLPSASGYVERGLASWYGNKFHGYMTSDFERYDMYAYSAAHKTLPLPSFARVTNLENGRSVIVRVNDRGPFVANRIIDLSYVAAVKLGVWPKGTAMVEVRGIDPAHPERSEPPRTAAVSARTASAAPQKTQKPALYLQVGAFADRVNAERAAAKVRAANLGEVRVVEAEVGSQTVSRVRLGPLKDADEADRLAPRLRELGLGTPRVAVDN